MAWNEPSNPNRDPWSTGRRSGPPDLDEMLKRLRARFSGRGGGPWSGGTAGLILLLALGLWLISGFYVVDEQERAAVLRFGAYVRSAGPGLHWRAPRPIESERKVNVTGVRSVTDKSELLTRDQNLADAEVTVQYSVRSAQDYLFNVADPDQTLRLAAKAALREVIGRSNMDFILGNSRQLIADQTRQVLQQRLDAYRAGLKVTEVSLQQVQPPDEVQAAFADAIKAVEDEKRLREEAEAYADDRLPKARGDAAREAADAAAYRDRVVADAQGESARFTELLAQYRKAPKVTRERMYLDTMSEILGSTGKVLVDLDKAGQNLSLPLAELLGRTPASAGTEAAPGSSAPAPRPGASPQDGRSRERGR